MSLIQYERPFFKMHLSIFMLLNRVGDGMEIGFWFCLFVIETLFLLIYAVRDLVR